MNRIIKFRIWDKIRNRFEPDGRYKNEFISIALGFGSDVCVSSDSLILQQFTGLCDKNGKEIFEGDIIEVNFNDGLNPNRICRVEWGHHGWELFYKNDSERPAYNNHFDGLTIIGNIFENPSILT